MSCGVGHRRGSDPAWLWLWRRLVATALIRPLAWEPPCATGVALEKAKRQKDKKKKRSLGTRRDTRGTHTEGRPREDTARRPPPVSQGERPPEQPDLPDLGLPASRTVRPYASGVEATWCVVLR